jgi:uncharacterized membrane protein
MTQFLGNFATLLGGTFGILVGVAIVGVVVGILVLPLIFMSKRRELDPDIENDVEARYRAEHAPENGLTGRLGLRR